MKDVLGLRKRRNAQSLVFFLLAWGTIMLLAGLAIDSGLLYLAKARLARAVDGAVLAAVGNFNRSGDPVTNRDDVALIMRNFAAANFTDLSSISANGGPAGGTQVTTTGSNGQPVTSYTYSFNCGAADVDPNGAQRRFVDVTLNTGSNGAITSATCNARCPVQTFFIGYASYAIGNRQNVKIGGYSGVSGLMDLKVSSSAVATRNPRLIMVVIDRSASMLQQGGGATGLPPAVVQFLDFFDTSSDTIGIVSFGSNARLEMPMTTNFIIAGTNNLIDAYETNVAANGGGLNVPGEDPEQNDTAGENDRYENPLDYNAGGVRRLKFGGQTAADDGIRLAMEQMMANSGFADPDVIKYMVIFTDGAWNAARTLIAAPGYENIVTVPATNDATHVFLTNYVAQGLANGTNGAWDTDLANDTNLLAMPSLGLDSTRSSLISLTNAIGESSVPYLPGDFAGTIGPEHTNDVWQSVDSSGIEPLGNPSGSSEGAYMTVNNTSWVGTNASGVNCYTHNFDVWLQPGAVAFCYTNNSANAVAYVSDYTQPNKHINLNVGYSGTVDLVVPGYIVDGLLFDGLDLTLSYPTTTGYPQYRGNNYQEQYMWSDDTTSPSGTSDYVPYYAHSLMRDLMFRNYPNLLTGYYALRADVPTATYNSSAPTGTQGIEPLITDQTNSVGAVGAPRSLYGLGAYYPSGTVYWPFGGETDSTSGYVTNAVGINFDPTFCLLNPSQADPDPNFSSSYRGGSRHISYSMNMLSSNAAPEWYGELFYNSISGTGTSAVSGTSGTTQSKIMHSSDWRIGAPGFLSPFVNNTSASGNDLMIDEATHNTTISGSPSVWRPVTFNGSNFKVDYSHITPINGAYSYVNGGTGGYVSDGNGNYYGDAMAWSGRPTHYYDFSKSSWEPIPNNHNPNQNILQMGNWKAQEYAWHARALGVTIFTVGYGIYVNASECSLLAGIANATNVIAPVSQYSTATTTNANTFNAGQPIGAQYYATTPADISNDFYSVGQAINAALTQ